MKKFRCFLVCSLALSSVLLFSCRKQVAEVAIDEASIASMTLPATTCKPEIFAVNMTGAGNHWGTLAQRWYSGDKIKYFKGNFSGGSFGHAGIPTIEPTLDIQWGEVKYEGNQVYLHDVGKNMLIFRATLDGSGRMIASYLDHRVEDASTGFMKDTSYYYYSGDRIDHIISISRLRLYPPNAVNMFRKYTFEYDAYGNILSVSIYPANMKMNFIYDYSMPVSGIVANYMLNTPFRLAEFLDLIKVPMHHALKEFNFGNYQGTTFNMLFQDNYYNYVLDDGRVHSYQKNIGMYLLTYYNGWNCGSMNNEPINRSKNGVKNLEEFQRSYPAPR